jgi:CPA2 family monovalent cation:H+ antiporter-2
MHHEVSLIAALAFGFGLALIFGFLAERLKAPALLGYLFAGFLIGPFTPGFVADVTLTNQLAEVGVMLLMFGVGMHFSMGDLMSVKKIAIPGAIVQMLAATLMGVGVAHLWDWPLGQSLVFGLALSVASTVVLLKALESKGLTNTPQGRIAVGWLVVEDLAMVLVLVLLPPLAPVLLGTQASIDMSVVMDIGLTLLKVALFLVLILVGGKRLIPWMLWHIAKTGSRELFTLSVIALAISFAYMASALFGVSFALGAFFAGMVMKESDLSHRAATESLPLRDAFAVLFFVSVGMLFQLQVVIDYPLRVLAVVGIIVLGKSLAAGILVLMFRYPLQSALTISASLAQIGEFSFILVSLGIYLGLADLQVQSLIVSGAIISIALNPLIFNLASKANHGLLKRFRWARNLNARSHNAESLPEDTVTEARSGHVILFNYRSHLAKRILSTFVESKTTCVVVDTRREVVLDLRKRGYVAVSGELTDPSTLVQAHIVHAKALILPSMDLSDITPICNHARMLNPDIQILVEAESSEEKSRISELNVTAVYLGEDLILAAIVEKLATSTDGQAGH